jgi:hypothetical protein
MTVGIASSFANSILELFRGTTFTAPAGCFVKLHLSDPGAAGASGTPSANTTRNAATFSAASGGSMSLSALSAWTMTASETVSHISLWSASTGGTFLQSAALTTPVPVINGSTLTVNTLTLSYSPVAA